MRTSSEKVVMVPGLQISTWQELTEQRHGWLEVEWWMGKGQLDVLSRWMAALGRCLSSLPVLNTEVYVK